MAISGGVQVLGLDDVPAYDEPVFDCRGKDIAVVRPIVLGEWIEIDLTLCEAKLTSASSSHPPLNWYCDRRFDTVFLYHNGADSYYAARAFRGSLRV